MDSMSMNNLASSLPPARNDELNVKFKEAAYSITTLYRSGLAAQQRAHNAGYVAALQDVLSFVQARLSSGRGGEDGIAAVMDWAEARAADMQPDEDDQPEEPPQPQPQTLPPAVQTKISKRPPAPTQVKENRRVKNTSPSPAPSSPVLGAKRRHALMFEPPAPVVSVVPEPRARKGKPRSSRVPNPLPVSFGGVSGSMEVDPDDLPDSGRERKRVARR